MWFSVLKTEFLLHKAGSVFVVAKTPSNNVIAKLYDLERCEIRTDVESISCGPSAARAMFTRPTKSLVDAMEDSVNQCEANYC